MEKTVGTEVTEVPKSKAAPGPAPLQRSPLQKHMKKDFRRFAKKVVEQRSLPSEGGR